MSTKTVKIVLDKTFAEKLMLTLEGVYDQLAHTDDECDLPDGSDLETLQILADTLAEDLDRMDEEERNAE